MIEEETGRIAVCQVSNPQGNNSQVKCDRVITYGKEIILIDDNPAPAKTNQIEKHQQPERKKAAEVHVNPVLNEKELLKRKIEEFGKNEPLHKTGEKNETIAFPQDFNVFEQRQLQFLQRKVLENDVQIENGGLLRAGEQITVHSLSAVKSRNTLMQLTAHVVK
jgi:hypothetical protein